MLNAVCGRGFIKKGWGQNIMHAIVNLPSGNPGSTPGFDDYVFINISVLSCGGGIIYDGQGVNITFRCQGLTSSHASEHICMYF